MRVLQTVMPITHKGYTDATAMRFAIVVARFNSVVTERLLQGAVKALTQSGADAASIEIVHVPGAFEIPLAAARLVATARFDAIIGLGAVVRGETQHHEYINHAVFGALQKLQVESRVPIALGVLTPENMEQALRRAADDPGNKGYESALTAIEMVHVLRLIK